MPINDELAIDDLVKLASDHIKSNYIKGKHHVAAALKTKSNIYFALHLDTKGFDVCAEPIAISNALANDDPEFECIVAVIMDEGGATNVISPCGNCRQILLEYAPKTKVIIELDGRYISKSPIELLPYAY
jgi:cytidine deaminase